MDMCCDLEVDVNGEGIFVVDQRILSSYCGKLRKLFGKSTSKKSNLRVIFHNFPGGILGFELVGRFCYNGGIVEVTPFNITLLYCASRFMEMDKSVSGKDNLAEQIEKSLQEISCYTWSDLLVALKQSQDLLLVVESPELIQKLVASLVGRLTLAGCEVSPRPSTSSPESSGFRVSCDSRSTDSLKTSCSRATWWFEDLLHLNSDLVNMAVKCLISRNFDHTLVGKFFIYYQKTKSVHVKSDEKCKIMETVIDNLCCLDHGSVSCKGYFTLLRAALNLNLKKQSRAALEGLTASRLDEATLDNLLMPAPNGVKSLYDVDLVLRLLRTFVNSGVCKDSDHRTKKVAELLDLFLAEVAPDPYLKPSKLIALAVSLPDSARESYDDMYQAVDMYLQVHTGLSYEDRLNVCCVLNYEKLSPETCLHLAHNKKFTTRSAVQALVYHQQIKLKDLLQEEPIYSPASCKESSPFSYSLTRCSKGGGGERATEANTDTQIMLYTENELEYEAENEKLRSQLQGMQCRVVELEKVCRKMQTQMTKIMKSSRSSSGGFRSRSLPKLCS